MTLVFWNAPSSRNITNWFCNSRYLYRGLRVHDKQKFRFPKRALVPWSYVQDSRATILFHHQSILTLERTHALLSHASQVTHQFDWLSWLSSNTRPLFIFSFARCNAIFGVNQVCPNCKVVATWIHCAMERGKDLRGLFKQGSQPETCFLRFIRFS